MVTTPDRVGRRHGSRRVLPTLPGRHPRLLSDTGEDSLRPRRIRQADIQLVRDATMITSRDSWVLPASFLVGLATRNIAAQEVLHTWANLESTSFLWIEDLDGDGHRDLIIGNALFDTPQIINAGTVLVVSGANGSVI